MSGIPHVFQYHRICQNSTDSNDIRICFYDNNYLCMCNPESRRAQCFNYDPSFDYCSNCLSNGRCVGSDMGTTKEFVCICPQCLYGETCQFSSKFLSFTLDSLFVPHSGSIQLIYFTFVILLVIFGSFNNICSFMTFKRRVPRKLGVGNYLFILSIINQCTLAVFLLKVLQILLPSSANIYLCKLVSYFLSVSTRSNYWLTSWITIERVVLVLWPKSLFLKKPSVALTISAFTLIIMFGSHIHEVIHYTIIKDSNNKILCVTDYSSVLVSTYNQISVLMHHFVPFCIQVSSITILIVFSAKSRAKTSAGKSLRHILQKQFQSQKDLYITPVIIVLSGLPQIIFSFSFACTPLNQKWRQHALLAAYCLAYLPQILGFLLFVLPSTTYKNEFMQTNIGIFLNRCISLTKKN